MIRSLALAPAVLVALASGCNGPRTTPTPPTPEVQAVATGDPFVLAEGASAEVGGHTLRFVDVVEDSRCPETATCVWAGRAKVRLAASAPDVPEATAVLTLPYAGMTEDESGAWAVGDVAVELLAVRPLPTGGDDGAAEREVEVRVVSDR